MNKITKAPILVIDNDVLHRRVIDRLSVNRNLLCYHAKNGFEGLSLLTILQFKMIFIDIDIPLMSGVEFAKKLREYEKKLNLPRTPLVAMSSTFEMKGGEAIKNAFVFDFQIDKPIHYTKFDELISSLKINNMVQEADPIMYQRISAL